MNSRFLRTLVVLAGVAAASGCDDPVNGSLEDLSASVSVSNPTFKSGQSITIATRLTNNGTRPVSIVLKECAWWVHAKVIEPTNSFAIGCIGSVENISITLGPSQTTESEFAWSGPDPEIQPLLPASGHFAVRAEVRTTSGDVISAYTPVEILPK